MFLATGLVAQQLQQQITEVREIYKAPAFEPHVTLLGGIRQSEAEVVRVAKLVAASLTVRWCGSFALSRHIALWFRRCLTMLLRLLGDCIGVSNGRRLCPCHAAI